MARVIVDDMGSQHQKVLRLAWCNALWPLILAGCYWPPDSDEQFEDSVVVTSRDENADFGRFQTYFLRPDIRVLDENNVDTTSGIVESPEILPAATAAPLLQETQLQLEARGYRATDVQDDADLAVELVYARNIYTDYYCYYWSDWGYWGYPGYYYYYPYSCDTVAWRSGMLATNVIDLLSAAPTSGAPVTPIDPAVAPVPPAEGTAPPVPSAPSSGSLLRGVWFSGVYGTEVESAAFVVSRATDGIDQAFKQSPYFSAVPQGE